MTYIPENCATCRFWQEWNEDDAEARGTDKILGRCRRLPPTFLPGWSRAESKEDPLNELTSIHTGFFPQTSPGEWCGEWKSRLNDNVRSE
jgi:hypothetical protein